jgi:protein-S-isoprenylcysteine O-methyltransferase Ste14
MVVGPAVLTGGFQTGEGLPGAVPLRALGAALILAGAGAVAAAFAQFVREGRGTPSPLAPAGRVVAHGVYRHLRHPMYAGTTAVLVGQALLLRRPVLLLAAAAYCATFVVVTRVHEEPLLRRRFGAAYDAYRREVPGWMPRVSRTRRGDRAPGR